VVLLVGGSLAVWASRPVAIRAVVQKARSWKCAWRIPWYDNPKVAIHCVGGIGANHNVPRVCPDFTTESTAHYGTQSAYALRQGNLRLSDQMQVWRRDQSRILVERAGDAFASRSVVWLAGVRHVGKTTLARSLPGVRYFDCELVRIRRALEDAELFWRDPAGRIDCRSRRNPSTDESIRGPEDARRPFPQAARFSPLGHRPWRQDESSRTASPGASVRCG